MESPFPILQTVPEISDEEFFSEVEKRNIGEDGLPIDPEIRSRMMHPVCLKCQEEYKQKFPGRPFGIKCEGIYSEPDFESIAAATEMEVDEAREILDVAFWASRHVRIPNAKGDLEYFIARDYQKESLLCTASRVVDRWGRGMGKTQISIIKELHTVTTRKRFNILVACPANAQAQKWFDEILQIINSDRGLRKTLVQTRQKPYFTFRFVNESSLNIFTTGSASGRDADTLRSQSPRRVTIDEQDLLNKGDYKAIMPLLRRYPDSEFHGMSTPTGRREDFWAMCKEYPDYRSLHFPINLHPSFSPEFEEACRREARTEINYIHEFLAEFGDQEGGVFKSEYVDAARAIPYKYLECRYDPAKHYFIGVDWNGGGTGTRFRVVEFDPATSIRRIVEYTEVRRSQLESVDELVRLNRRWHAERVYIDKGFGYVQDELIRQRGVNATCADDRRLKDVVSVDFGANLVTNSLVPNRGNTVVQQNEELERPTKPFLVEGAQMLIEMGLFQFSPDDKILDEQLRAYRVKTYSRHGWANVYESKVGDHDLDATMLALLGVELKYGLTKTPNKRPAAVGTAYTAGFGSGKAETPRDVAAIKGNVPQRSLAKPPIPATQRIAASTDRYGNLHGMIARLPSPKTPDSRVPSRTGMFGPAGGRTGGRGKGLLR